MSEDPFLKMVKAKEDEKRQKYRDALTWANSEARTEGSFDFIKSCQAFFDKRGYLTEKQTAALFAMDRNYYPASSHGYDDDIIEQWDLFK